MKKRDLSISFFVLNCNLEYTNSEFYGIIFTIEVIIVNDNKKTLEELKKQYDTVVSEIEKILKKDKSKNLAEFQQKLQPLLAQKDTLAQQLNQMYQLLKSDFENQRKQLKAKEAEIRKQAKIQKQRAKEQRKNQAKV